MADEILCRSCKFWQRHTHMGVCKRYPVVANKSETDWCGEHESKISLVVNIEPEPQPEPKRVGRPRKIK